MDEDKTTIVIVNNQTAPAIEAPEIETETETEPAPTVLIIPPMATDDSAEMALSVPKSIVETVKAFIANLINPDEPAFKVFKAANGRNAWIARYTGKWIDRENEIVADAAQTRYVERVLKGIVPMPELWMWHAKGTKHGQAVAVWRAGGFTMAAGYFDENAVGERAFRYYQKHAGKIKLSHMFHFPRETKIGNVYNELNTIEITTLPDGAEAFPYTSFEEIQTMALPAIAQDMIKDALGEDVLQVAVSADTKAEKDSKALDGQGIASKNYDQYDGSQLLEAAAKLQTFEQERAAEKARLEATEKALAELADLPAVVKALNDSVKLLSEQLEASQKAESAALERVNALEKKAAEFSDLKPPASQSTDTLLSTREKSLIDSVMATAKAGDQLSLVEKLVGGQPAVSVNGGSQ